MLPFNSSPQLVGPPTAEMMDKLGQIKYCVIGVFFAAVGRMCTGDMPFNDLLCGINGIFLLRDDVSVGTCYACLVNSPLGHCAGPTGGGLACLMPFLFLASFNCIFLALKLFTGGPFDLVSFCFQSVGAVIAWRLNSLVTLAAANEMASGQDQPLTQPLAAMRGLPPGLAGLGGPPGAGGPLGGFGGMGGMPRGGIGGPGGMGGAGGMGAGGAPPRGQPPGGGGGAPGAPRPGGFTAFQGTGQRLGG